MVADEQAALPTDTVAELPAPPAPPLAPVAKPQPEAVQPPACVEATASTVRLYQNMRDLGWLGTKEDKPFDPERVMEEYARDPELLERRLRGYVPESVQRDFVTPLTTGMEGRSAFYGPTRIDGITPVGLWANRMMFGRVTGIPT